MTWTEIGPWRNDPLESLDEVQSRISATYDLKALVETGIDSTRQEIASWEAVNDPYELLEGCRQHLVEIEEVQRQLPPKSAAQRLAMLRKIRIEEIGNILDVTGISADGGLFQCRLLSDTELIKLHRKAKPTRGDAEQIFGKMWADLERGDSVCFQIYDEAGEPVGWFFGGGTVD